jgi:hypothetical protein
MRQISDVHPVTNPTGTQPAHLLWAERLIADLQLKHNKYGSQPTYIKWKGVDGAKFSRNRTICSSFITELLKRAYGYKARDIRGWMGVRKPNAARYYAAIEQQNHFQKINHVQDIQPGDLIAIRYTNATNASDTARRPSGHVAVVAKEPVRRDRATSPKVRGTIQYELTVIDSSHSGHGSSDTRRLPDQTWGDAGAGMGTMRLYTDEQGQVVGHTWSLSARSKYYDQTVRTLSIGRFKPL